MSGGRVELGLGAGWYDAEHTAYGVPFQPLGERFERLEEQFAILTGLWATPVGETFDFDGRPLPVEGQPGVAQARPATPPAAHRGRWRRQADATPCGDLRRRVQPARSPRSPTPRRSSAESAPPARTGTVTPGRCGSRPRRPSVAGPTRPRWSAAPPTSAASPMSCGSTAWPGTPEEVVARLQAFAAIGAHWCTSRCWISTTSTTSTCWRRKCCRTSDEGRRGLAYRRTSTLRARRAVLISPWSWRAAAEPRRAPRQQRQRSARGTHRTPSRRLNHLA